MHINECSMHIIMCIFKSAINPLVGKIIEGVTRILLMRVIIALDKLNFVSENIFHFSAMGYEGIYIHINNPALWKGITL